MIDPVPNRAFAPSPARPLRRLGRDLGGNSAARRRHPLVLVSPPSFSLRAADEWPLRAPRAGPRERFRCMGPPRISCLAAEPLPS